MSSGDRVLLAETSDDWSPMWCVHEQKAGAPETTKRFLQREGFGGGVPLNTETAAVKLRAGIEWIARR